MDCGYHFWIDPYQIEATTRVKQLHPKGILLSETIFYPESGGQGADQGVVIFQNKTYHVEDVQKVGDDILLQIPDLNGQLSVGDEIVQKIDWKRRYALMRTHTTQHLISAFLEQNYGYKTIDISLGEDELTIYLDQSLSYPQLEECMVHVNEITQFTTKHIQSHVLSPEIAQTQFATRIRGGFSTESIVRILEIEDWDVMCCGGTHVKETTEIGLVLVHRFNKGKEIRCLIHQKAFRSGVKCNIQAIEIGSQISQPYDKIGNQIGRMMETITESRILTKNLFDAFLDLFSKGGGKGFKSTSEVKFYWIPFEIERKIFQTNLKKFPPNSIIGATVGKDQLMLATSCSFMNLQILLSEISTAYQGKGGGSPKVIQGKFNALPDNIENDLEMRMEKLLSNSN